MLVAWAFALLVADGVDYRSAQSPVKDQNPRGTCAAFAVAAAIETLPGTAADVSEQFLYAIVKKRQLDVDRLGKAFPSWASVLREGDPLGEYAALFTLIGAPPERVLPYQNGLVELPPGTPPELATFLKLAQIGPADLEKLRDAWGKYGIAADGVRVLDAAEARDVDKIKALLRGGVLAVPVAYALYSPAWSLADPKALLGNDPKHPRFTPDHMEEFKRNIDLAWMRWDEASRQAREQKIDLAAALGPLAARLEKPATGPLAWTGRLREPIQDAKGTLLYGGHAVTIVGFDDRGFLIKNSWSEAWGESGYAVISYDYHRLYTTGALEVRKPSIRMPALSPFERAQRLAAAEVHLKLQPVRAALWDQWRISLYTMGMRDPPVDAVEYDVQTEGPGGTWTSAHRQVELARSPGGFPIVLEGIRLSALRGKGARARVVARLGFDIAPDGRVMSWAATRTFGPFDVGTPQMQVLVGR